MTKIDLLTLARQSFDAPDARVEAVVLRRYRNGRPECVRIDDSMDGTDVPSDFNEALVVIGMPFSTLIHGEVESKVSR